MGSNSQVVDYGFGQMGSGHIVHHGAEVFAPKGKVIVAITFLENTTLAGLVADTAQGNDAAFFSHTTAVAGNGTGAAETDAGTSFPKGLTIYGRWTSVTPSAASTTGGIICYFGE